MKKLTALLLALALCLGLAACGSNQADFSSNQSSNSTGSSSSASSQASSQQDAQSSMEGTSTDYEGTDVNIAVLSGPTGIGAVGLMEANDAGETVNHYNFTVTAANDEVVAGLSNGDYVSPLWPPTWPLTFIIRPRAAFRSVP